MFVLFERFGFPYSACVHSYSSTILWIYMDFNGFALIYKFMLHKYIVVNIHIHTHTFIRMSEYTISCIIYIQSYAVFILCRYNSIFCWYPCVLYDRIYIFECNISVCCICERIILSINIRFLCVCVCVSNYVLMRRTIERIIHADKYKHYTDCCGGVQFVLEYDSLCAFSVHFLFVRLFLICDIMSESSKAAFVS